MRKYNISFTAIVILIQCNPDIRELSGQVTKSLISGVWSILFR